MEKIKVIDLLNKIANGEEVPKKIKYCGVDYYWTGFNYENSEADEVLFWACIYSEKYINDEVEIIEDKPQPKPITKKDLEALGYAFGEMRKALQNGWDKSLNNEPFKEDKKIEKIDFDLLQSFEDDDDKYVSIHAICKKLMK